jgi:TetR/AcrR family transcriptional regulator, ethionamide resistance regulator
VSGPPSVRAQRRAVGPRKGERREAEILDALEQLLDTTPFAQLTMDDLARKAGLSRSALYFYFASKDEALSALHERIYGEMARTTDSMTVDGATTVDAMRAAIEEVCATWRAHPAALRTFRETAMSSESFGQQWRERLERHVTTLTGLIERERSAGRATPGPPDAHAIASAWFWMFEHQLFTLFRGRPTAQDVDELIDLADTLWIRMIGAT